MEEFALTNQEKLSLLVKTKEMYVKQYIACVLNYQKSISSYYEPIGMCGCFYKACKESGYSVFNVIFQVSNIIPEWNRSVAYQVNQFDYNKCRVYSSIDHGYWFPIWDKVSRVNYLNWLIDKYTKASTEIY